MKIFKSTILVAALVVVSSAPRAAAAVIARYNFATVSNGNTASASSANVAAAAPGVTASNFTVVGGSGTTISISSATSTAYEQGSVTPDAASIYTNTRYFTFNVALTSAYDLTSLTFGMGGTNTASSGAPTNFTFGAQIRIGSGTFVDLPTNTPATSVPFGTSTNLNLGTYSADLSAYSNITDTATIRIFIADDSNVTSSSGRISDVQLIASPVPEPATGLLGAMAAIALLRRRR